MADPELLAVIAATLRVEVHAGADETPEEHRAGLVADAVTAAGFVIASGVTLFGQTMCPHCLGEADAVFWNEDIAGEDGLCECCGGAGEVLVLTFVDTA